MVTWKLKNVNGGWVLSVHGGLSTLSECMELRSFLCTLINRSVHSIAIDFTEVDYMTGSFCGFLSAAYKVALQKQVEISAIASPDSHALKVLKAFGFDNVIAVYANLETYVQART